MESVRIQRSVHGPFERFLFTVEDGSEVPASVSVYRIGDTLIDTGGTRIEHVLLPALSDLPIRRIICTHQHEDHVGGITRLREGFGHLPVYVPTPYVELLKTFDRVPAYRAAYWGTPRPVQDAIGYELGTVFECEGARLRAVPTPGHTPFHVALIAEQRDHVWALTGDLYTTSPLVAFFESAADDAIASARALCRLGANLRMLPTHGKVRDDGQRVLASFADLLERESDRVLDRAVQLGTRDYWSLSDDLYGVDPQNLWQITEGEFSGACFVRSVLDPVRALPATPLLRS